MNQDQVSVQSGRRQNIPKKDGLVEETLAAFTPASSLAPPKRAAKVPSNDSHRVRADIAYLKIVFHCSQKLQWC